MEENKYYTPKIEEFHNNFRFKILLDKWEEMIFNLGNSFQYSLIKRKEIRVKYLDKQDIEELGWEQIKTDYRRNKIIDTYTFIKDNYYLIFYSNKEALKKWSLINANIEIYYIDDENLKIRLKDINTNYTFKWSLVKCNIKNYNELQKLMKQLNIIKDE